MLDLFASFNNDDDDDVPSSDYSKTNICRDPFCCSIFQNSLLPFYLIQNPQGSCLWPNHGLLHSVLCHLMQMFGKEASEQLDYVECFPDGLRKGTTIAKACANAKIEGFPTWVINGEVRKLTCIKPSMFLDYKWHLLKCFSFWPKGTFKVS